jgi:imidazole glycerol-phosphate synthase subunit HisF
MTDAGEPRAHRPRVIPVLLLMGGLLHKTVRFAKPRYVGDPRIAVKIFNDKGADEIVLLDVRATLESRPPDYRLIEEIAGECFMPLAYGGGVRDVESAQTLFNLGVEKVIVNTAAVADPSLVTAMSERFGSQSVVGAIDVKRDWLDRPRVVTHSATRRAAHDVVAWARRLEALGAGEILLHSVDRDGTFKGYDIPLIRQVAHDVGVPVVACGGASRIEDCVRAVREGGASAAAAGSIFVFQGVHRAVLINFPTDAALASRFENP